MPEISLPFQITYETKNDVPVALVARSLLAHEALIGESVILLKQISGGTELHLRGIRVASVSNSSPLKEILAVGIFLAFQDDLVDEVPSLFTRLTGVPVTEGYETLLTVAVMLVAISVVDQVVQRFFPGKDAAHLKSDYQRKLKALAELTGKDPDEIAGLVNDSLSSKLRQRVIKAAFDFFAPSVNGGSVPITGPDGHVISRESILEVPRDLDFLMNEGKESYFLEDAVVDIHRADRDSNKAGWRAIIDVVSTNKIRMELAPDIDPNSLYGKTTVVGDVFVVEERDGKGVLVPKMLHLMRVKDEHKE